MESARKECFEPKQSGIAHARHVPLAIVYNWIRLDCGYRLDIVVQRELIIEIKSAEQLLPIHEGQILTYSRLGKHKIGLLMNFNTVVLKDGIRRLVL